MLLIEKTCVALGMVALITGCSGNPSQEATVPSAPSWTELVNEAIPQATDRGASARQIAILTNAQKTGDITLASAREATQATVDCMTSAGVDASYVETEAADGELPLPGFRVRVDADGAVNPLVTACENQESAWVNHLYQVQPRAVEKRNANIDRHMPELLACLAERGFAPDADATRDEIFVAITNEAIATNTSNGVSCLSRAGISSL